MEYRIGLIRVVIVNPTYMSPAPGPDSCWGRRPAARSLLVAELLLLKTSRIIYLRCHFVTTKGVNEPSQSFIVPRESPYLDLSLVENAFKRGKCRCEIRTLICKDHNLWVVQLAKILRGVKIKAVKSIVPTMGTVKLREVPLTTLFVTTQLPESRHQGFLLLSQKQVFFIQTRYFLIL